MLLLLLQEFDWELAPDSIDFSHKLYHNMYHLSKMLVSRRETLEHKARDLSGGYLKQLFSWSVIKRKVGFRALAQARVISNTVIDAEVDEDMLFREQVRSEMSEIACVND
eukprot:GHVU01041157.1.p1 GENE.GHVU01041157.1~~GHVU01041157.1.p1  ORF type:complete len:110 (+),score=21.27 GHVU01041157.1:160-489(+)